MCDAHDNKYDRKQLAKQIGRLFRINQQNHPEYDA